MVRGSAGPNRSACRAPMPLISRIHTNLGPAQIGQAARRKSLEVLRPRARFGVVGRGPLAEEVRQRLRSPEAVGSQDGVRLEWVADADLGPSLWLSSLLRQSIDVLLIDAGPATADQAARALERGIDVVLNGEGLQAHEVTRLGRIAARSEGRLRWCTAPDSERLERALSALARSA
jgi:hypothetical protein